MPLTKDKKKAVVSSTTDLFNNSKMTVIANYQGITVKEQQKLRKQALASGTKVKVIKNRLVMQAIKSNPNLSKIDLSKLEGMLTYAFNQDDEIAPAQSLFEFAKTNPNLEFVGAITKEGNWLGADEITTLAQLPPKPILIAQVVSMLNAPLRSIIGSLDKSLPQILSGLEAKLKTN